MKLAEALALRSDASKRFEQLRSRAQANARTEGEAPARTRGSWWPRRTGCLQNWKIL